MYILYGGKFTRATGPQMVLEEASLPYEMRDVDIVAGEHRGEEFLSMNPAGYIPALVTPEGNVLHEAAAIMLYLADLHHLHDLVPCVDSPERGVFYSKYFYLTNDIQPAMKRYYFPDRYSSNPDDKQRIKAKAFDMAMDRWSVVERHLVENGPCHMGEKVGLIDYYMAVWAAFGFEDDYNLLEDHAAIRACYNMVRERPHIKPLLMEIENVLDDYVNAMPTSK